MKKHVFQNGRDKNKEYSKVKSGKCFYLTVRSKEFQSIPNNTAESQFSHQNIDDIYSNSDGRSKQNFIDVNDYRLPKMCITGKTQCLTDCANSVSSGVSSGNSNDISPVSPSPRIDGFRDINNTSFVVGQNMTVSMNGDDFETMKFRCNNDVKNKATQTDKFESPRRLRGSYSSENSRRDSGYSSVASPRTPNSLILVPRTPNSSILVPTTPNSSILVTPPYEDEYIRYTYNNDYVKNARHNDCVFDNEKELLMQSLRHTNFNWKMEMLLSDLKKSLKQNSSSVNNKEWRPIRESQPKSVLKISPPKNETRLFLKSVINSSQHSNWLKYKDAVKIIQQVRDCLDIVNETRDRPIKYKNIDTSTNKCKKIRLRSYKKDEHSFEEKNKTDIMSLSSQRDGIPLREVFVRRRIDKLKSKLEISKENKCLSTDTSSVQPYIGEVCHKAGQGRVKDILEIMKTTNMDVTTTDHNDHPPLHYALKNKHLTTAILLIEAGTDLREYTAKRIEDYNKTLAICHQYSKGIT